MAIYIATINAVIIILEFLCLSPTEKKEHVRIMIITSSKEMLGVLSTSNRKVWGALALPVTLLPPTVEVPFVVNAFKCQSTLLYIYIYIYI